MTLSGIQDLADSLQWLPARRYVCRASPHNGHTVGLMRPCAKSKRVYWCSGCKVTFIGMTRAVRKL